MTTERMVPTGIPGRWIRAEVAADHPSRKWNPLTDSHLFHVANELSEDGWTRDGDDWVRPI